MKIKRYGWIPQHPDQRDRKLSLGAPVALPPSVDLRPQDVPTYDQGQLGSCTANGICGAYLFDRKKQGLPTIEVSRLFLYFNERSIEGTTAVDAGANIRDGFKTLASQGVCLESLWPYDITQFAVTPPSGAYLEGEDQEAIQYNAVAQDLTAIKMALASGFNVVFGITVYESFESQAVAQTGNVPMPDPSESVLGGHCIRMVGYDDSRSVFICANSWGIGWGDSGYFYLPYAYATDPDLASDFWAVEVVK